MNEFSEAALERINKECRELHGNRNVMLIKDNVADALLEFCKQDGEFAQAVVQGGSFGDCMAKVVSGINSVLSDLEAYRRAAAFYFPGADIHFDMRIDLCAGVGGEDKPKNGVLISLDSFFE